MEWRWVAAGVGLMAASSGCGGEERRPEGETFVEGRLYSAEKLEPLADAHIAVMSAAGDVLAETTTGPAGKFATGPVPGGATEALVTFEAPDHKGGLAVVGLPEAATAELDLFASTVTKAATLDATKGGAITTPEGVGVILPQDSLSKGGAPVSGDVQVEITRLMPTAAASLSAIPGAPVVKGSGDTETAAVFKGVLGVSMSQGDEKVQLRSGSKATLQLHAAGGDAPPSKMNLYALNEATGKWQPEGTARKAAAGASGVALYKGFVSHLSWWFVGDDVEQGCVSGCVQDAAGQASVGTAVRVRTVDLSFETAVITDDDGCFEAPVPGGTDLAIRAGRAAAQSPLTEARATPGASCAPVGPLVLAPVSTSDGDCPQGFVGCGGTCVDLASDAAHCGACDSACDGGTTDGPEGAVCVAGACACGAGTTTCPLDAVDMCLATQTDPNACGDCTTTCTASQTCDAGGCRETACGDGIVDVGELCLTPADRDLPLGTTPRDIGSGDLNGDGHQDLVVAQMGDQLVVYFGDGRGGFTAGTPQALDGSSTVALRVVDLDGDGDLDVAASIWDGGSTGAGGINLFYNAGDGELEAGPGVDTPYPWSLAVGDFDGNGHVDLVTGSRNSTDVALSLQQPNGSFDPVVTTPLGEFAAGVEAVDLDGDAADELLVATTTTSPAEGTVIETFEFDTETMKLEPAGTSPVSTENLDPEGLVVADFDDDGALDAVVASRAAAADDPVWSFFPGSGTGFDAPTALSDVVTDGGTHPVAGDLNGDGVPDLVALDGAGYAAVFTYDPGLAAFVGSTPEATASDPTHGTVADLDEDGFADVAVIGNGATVASLLGGSGDGTLHPGLGPVRVAVGEDPRAQATADVNSDGVADVVVVGGLAGEVNVALGTVDGRPRPGPTTALPAETIAHDLAAGDVNGDGVVDLVLATDGDRILRMLGEGDGTFAAPDPIETAWAAGQVVLVDADANGVLDLVASSLGTPDGLRVYLGSGDGSFAEPVDLAASRSTAHLALGDANGDGVPDLLVATGAAGTVDIWLGDGDGSFVTPTDSTLGGLGNAVQVSGADLDGDGHMDLLVRTDATPGIVASLADGAGGHGEPATVYGDMAGTMATADLDADGHTDLVVASTEGADVLLGDGLGGFAAEGLGLRVGTTPLGTEVADFDADGALDLAVVSDGSHDVFFHRARP